MLHLLKVTYKECSSENLCNRSLGFAFNLLFRKPLFDQANLFLCSKLNFLKISKFYLAKFYFFYKKFDLAEQYINEYLKNKKEAPKEALYLKAHILMEKKDFQQSLDLLLALDSSYTKKWIYLYRLCLRAPELLVPHYALFQPKEDDSFFVFKYKITCLEQLGFKKEVINALKHKPIQEHFKEKRVLQEKDAIQALVDIHQFFNQNKVEFFLVSGTFLACVREKKFIPGDYDIDLGVFCDLPQWYELCNLLASSCNTYFIESINDYCAKLIHRNGTKLDVFRHVVENDVVFHYGKVVKWANSKFSLAPYKFYNLEFLAPSNFQQYLSENYKNWREKLKYYDNILETPNSSVIDQESFLIHLYKIKTNSYGLHNKEKINQLIGKLEQEQQ